MSKRVKVPLRATGSRFFFMTHDGKHHDNHEQQKEANSEENDSALKEQWQNSPLSGLLK